MVCPVELGIFCSLGDEVAAAKNFDFYDEELRGLWLQMQVALFTHLHQHAEHPDYEKRAQVPETVSLLLATWDELGRDEAFYQFDVDNVWYPSARVQVNVQGPIDTTSNTWQCLPLAKRDFWPDANSAHFCPEGNEGLYFGSAVNSVALFRLYAHCGSCRTIDEFRIILHK